ncbi:response regulator [Larkinella rosea]|uniref:Response regulator n=1 Tax=Larkinella rosea TaxID=2025312 RepID=A0A3P1C0H9_9BACT|nr:response regulator [Larkinella rosea]RRB06911.1 response regulator [Larkinella rosea]
MKTILLIEDNEGIRENTAEILELTGYRVFTAENGKIGVEKALAHKPDLVICDIMMPVLDGYGVLLIFNKNPELAGIPFIFLTAKTERSEFRKGMELGADDYLTKPFEESELLSAIEGRLNRFVNLMPVDPLQQDGFNQFLNEAGKIDNLHSLSIDRKVNTVRKKQFVYSEGDEPTRLFFLKSGKVKTIRINTEGKEFITGIYNSGDFFGYLALLEGVDYTDSAVTLEDSQLVYIPKGDFQALVSVNPEISSQFIKMLASYVGEREQQLLSMAYNSIRRRVADTLLRLAVQEPDGIIQLSRDNLAAVIGTATETMIRSLTEFRQEGYIEILPSGGIRVILPEKLRKNTW